MTLYLVMAWWPNTSGPVPLHHGSGLGVAAYSDRGKALARARREKARRPEARFAVAEGGARSCLWVSWKEV